MRIDVYLAECGLAHSRTEAKSLIADGLVFVGDLPVTKPSLEVDGHEGDVRVVSAEPRFVSRGGIKLAGALSSFGINVKGKRCLDIGASSGGFTDCLLRAGAAHVIAVDSGSGQLAEKLRADDRVSVREGYNARYMKRDDFEYVPELAVMDVSFISVTHILPSLFSVLDDEAELVCLIKPQFEVGRAYIGKGGIVKDDKARARAVDGVVDFARSVGFNPKGIITSPIKGGDGNIEFLAYFTKEMTDEKGSHNTKCE
ncbi:MAG: TlyA family RNA methyltransferase [Clostridia bacterium]|nr:TlyA family RNA methyltransferase [Clostridia bacterium]